MKKVNCILVDDEPASRDVLRRYIADTDTLNLVSECKNAIEANEVVKSELIDLMFLDINMPKISGLQFIKSLPSPPKVIFTTAYPEFALEGFELNAVDYLLKPFSFERFLKAVNKYSYSADSQSVLNSRTILLKSEKKLYRVPISDILYFEAIGDYVKVVFGGQSILVHSTFQDILEQFSHPDIVRIHRSFAIAINKFDHIEGNQIFIEKKALPIGKAYKKDLIDKLDK
ncbi:MAG: LytTR family DNA-binding domain-containing protein [Bacteroidales bacterium]|nr:LytTR family DNA-binding domain-containing protein [Bacteroidales bacterium]